MSDTTRTPYVSDELISEVIGSKFIPGFNDYNVASGAARAMRNIYEARLSEVIKERDEARENLEKSESLLDADQVMKIIESTMTKRCRDHTPYYGACITCGHTDNPLVLPSLEKIRRAILASITPDTPPSNG